MGYVIGIPGGSHPSHGGGALGFVKNLVKDVGDAARGTPEGLVQLATHPVRTAENVGKQTWQDWSPLFHGHVGQFAHQVYDHPLAPMLDIATAFTGGAALAGKLGLEVPESIAISGEAAGRGANALTRTKYLPKNPIYNKGARVLMSQADKNPFVPNFFSTSKVYDRLESKDWASSGLALNAQIAAAMKAGETFAKANHSDWAYLEQHLFSENYKRLIDHSPTVPLKQVIRDGGKAPEGMTFVRQGVDASQPLFKDGHAKNLDEFGNHVQNLGKVFTTKDMNQASTVLKDGEVHVRLAHDRSLEATYRDARNSAHFLAKLYRFPTTIWKAVTLGYSPRVVVNNGIGNWLMYIMRQGGAHGLKGFVDAVRYTQGEKAALRMLRDTGKLPPQHFLNHFFGDEIQNTSGSSVLHSNYLDTRGKAVGGTGTGVAGTIYKKSLYGLVHTYADVPVRAAAISAFLRGDPLVKNLMKAGHSFDDAATAALRAKPGLRERAVLHARTVAGNYATLNKGEQLVRDFVPFYLWNKHIVMHATNMLRDRPAVVTAGTGVGQQGAAATRKKEGDIPGWMLGGVPIHMHIPGEGTRQTLFNTQGMNPYSTVPDLVELAQALGPGGNEDNPADTILGMANPVIRGLVEHTMGQKATGAPITSHGGVIPSTLVDVLNSLRPTQLLREAAGAKKNTKLYRTDWRTQLSAWAGIPLQEADLERAHALAQQIVNGGKKPKKGQSPYSIGR